MNSHFIGYFSSCYQGLRITQVMDFNYLSSGNRSLCWEFEPGSNSGKDDMSSRFWGTYYRCSARTLILKLFSFIFVFSWFANYWSHGSPLSFFRISKPLLRIRTRFEFRKRWHVFTFLGYLLSMLCSNSHFKAIFLYICLFMVCELLKSWISIIILQDFETSVENSNQVRIPEKMLGLGFLGNLLLMYSLLEISC